MLLREVPTQGFSAWAVGSKPKCSVLRGKLCSIHLCMLCCPLTEPRLKLHSLLSVLWTLLPFPLLFLLVFSLPTLSPCCPDVANPIPEVSQLKTIPLQSVLWFHQSTFTSVPTTNDHLPLWIPKTFYFYITYDNTFYFVLQLCFTPCIRI